MPSEVMMEFRAIKSALFIVLALLVLSAAAEPADTEPKSPQPAAEPVQDISAESRTQIVEPATRFTPSEKLRADDAVSFPVDI